MSVDPIVIEGRPRPVGSIQVARLLPSPHRKLVGPFIFIDHMGPVELAPGVGFDVRPHPHIGLSTVTYFLSGENVHRDSLGSVQKNIPGDLNIMTAGRGVVHSERADPAFRAKGGLMHGMQLWLALPEENEDDEPSFEHHPEVTLPPVGGEGWTGRVLLGEAFGARSPVTHPARPLLVDLVLSAGARVELPDVAERGVVVIEGTVDGHGSDTLSVLAAGPHTLVAETDARVMLVGGGEMTPRFIDWNFVASSKERIDRARDAWKAQTFPQIPDDHDEHIPYPELHQR